MLRGSKWRDMRATLSPAFTGSKMRQMFDLISECSEEMSKILLNQAKDSGRVDCEMKDLFTKYTNDVISSAAFGCKTNSFENPNNEFYLSGKKIMEFSSTKAIFRMTLIFVVPKLASLLNVTFIDKKASSFFRSLVMDNISTREKLGIFRPDMINILINVKKGNSLRSSNEETTSDGFATVGESSIGNKIVKREWTDDELVAQAFLFFLAGFDTVATLLSFLVYELSIGPDVQQTLYEEIKETHKALDGQRLTYDVIQKMKYMDMVISETLRLWPPAVATDRVCVKDYNYDDGQCKFTIEKGTALNIPICSLHMDEKYWTNPTKFDPLRFSEENKDSITPGTYLPFGDYSFILVYRQILIEFNSRCGA